MTIEWQQLPRTERSIDLAHSSFSRKTVVFVIGAGASKDAGFPICADLVSQDFIRQIESKISERSRKVFHEYVRGYSSFEELLAAQIEEGNLGLYNHLLKFYEEVFFAAESTSAQEERTDDWFFGWGYFLNFIFFASHPRAPVHPVFITFNHDLLLEYAGTTGRDYGLSYNYGTLTNRLFCFSDSVPQLPEFGYDMTFLKLHGSFNFLGCDNCSRILSWPDYMWKFGGIDCPICDKGKLRSLYIPPSTRKNYDPLLCSWQDAASALRRAELIFVIGYSLPQYDREAKALLMNTNPSAELYIIDKCASRVAPNYADIPSRQKFFRSVGLREFSDEIQATGNFGNDRDFVQFT